MKDKKEGNHQPSDLTKLSIGFFITFFILASAYVVSFSLSINSYYIDFALIPMISLILLSIYYLIMKNPIESFDRLIIIDAIMILLILTCLLLVLMTFIDPQTNYMFYYLLSLIQYLYIILLIPLIGVILLTIHYIRLNIPIRNKKYKVIVLIFLGLIITLFIVNYCVMNLILPIIHNYLRSLPYWD